MILKELIFFSVLMTSLFYSSEVLKIRNHKIKKQKTNFIIETKKTLRRGSMLYLNMILLLLFSSLLILFCLSMEKDYLESTNRKNAYLCYHFLNMTTKNFVDRINDLNKLLTASYLASLNPGTRIEALILHNTLIANQQITLGRFLKTMTRNNYCHKNDSLPYLTSYPYEIKSSFDHTLNIKSSNIRIIFQRQKIKLLVQFLIPNKYSQTIIQKQEELWSSDLSPP